MKELKSLRKLVTELSKLPGIGEKSAQRLAYFILKRGTSYTQPLLQAIQSVENEINECPKCFSYTELAAECEICSDIKRDGSIYCVVEEPFDIMKIESAQAFQGYYHVLHGTISPLEGIQPEHLKIQELIQRIETSATPVKEVILALDSDIEGDTTALYLTKLLSQKKIRTTRLAYGVPFGSDIDYIDKRTLGKAIENRMEL